MSSDHSDENKDSSHDSANTVTFTDQFDSISQQYLYFIISISNISLGSDSKCLVINFLENNLINIHSLKLY